MRYLYNNAQLKLRRKYLRNNLGLPEVILWNYLKGNQLGKKFRRQYGIGKFVLDFYCPELRLGIELDGASHDNPISFEKDAERQRFIERQGIKVERFHNNDILANLNGVIEKIKQLL